jgi:hypothetical protein
MEYHEQLSLKDKVNKKNSKLWTKMNDNSKAAKNRAAFVAEHGGFFTKDPSGWIWHSPVEENNGYWLQNVVTQEKVFFSNMKEFGEKNGLSSVKICELLNGKRKTYKNWTAVELREVNDTSGRFEKEKEEAPKKIAVTKSATFIDTKTGEIMNISNIGQFAKDNNIDSNALYKVARGALKSYKNLKLYNPLEKYDGLSNT